MLVLKKQHVFYICVSFDTNLRTIQNSFLNTLWFLFSPSFYLSLSLWSFSFSTQKCMLYKRGNTSFQFKSNVRMFIYSPKKKIEKKATKFSLAGILTVSAYFAVCLSRYSFIFTLLRSSLFSLSLFRKKKKQMCRPLVSINDNP